MRITGVNKQAFRKAIVDASGGCAIQYNGWPCGTCFCAAFDDYTGNDWRAVLAYRGDSDNEIEGDHIKMCVDIEHHPDGRFKAHVFADIPLYEIRTRILNLAHRLGVTRSSQYDKNQTNPARS